MARVIALEEHYFDAEVAQHFQKSGPEARSAALRERLEDVGALRLREMDQAGIDIQVLSHGAPATQRMDAETAVPVARRANDKLKQLIDSHPDRFRGFAALPTADPKAAADELERAVAKLGFKGAMLHGLANGVFLDDRRFWPIFERDDLRHGARSGAAARAGAGTRSSASRRACRRGARSARRRCRTGRRRAAARRPRRR